MTVTRRTAAWLAAGAAVVVAAAIGVVLLVAPHNVVPGSATRATTSPVLPYDWHRCADASIDFVIVYFDRDEDMRAAADALRRDDRIRDLVTETKMEAYERFKRIFADQPELVKLARPEALPASVSLRPADGVSSTELADQLRAEFTTAAEVRDQPCDLPAPTTR